MSESKLAKNTFILGVGTIVNKGLMFLMLPLFTRWLSTEEYGTYDVLATYVTLLIPIITVASSNAIFRLSVDKEKEIKKQYITNGLYLVACNLFVSMVILAILNYYLHITNFVSFAIMLSCEVLDNYFQGYLRAVKKLSMMSVFKMASTVTSVIMITVFIKLMNMGLSGLILGYSCGFFLDSFLIILFTQYWEYIQKTKFSFDKVKEIVSYSWVLVPNDICWWIINVSDRQIIYTFLGPAANGIYAIAYKVPNLCSAVFGVFNISWQEAATDSLHYEKKLEHYNNVLNKVVSTLLALSVGIISCNFILFNYIFDERFSDSRLYSPILLASVFFSVLSLFYGGIQISLKRPSANGITTMIGALANLIIHLSLVNVIGLYAAALSTLISNMIVMYSRMYLLRKDYRLTILKKQYCYGLVFVYYAFMAMNRLPLWIDITNLIIALIIMGIVIHNTLIPHNK